MEFHSKKNFVKTAYYLCTKCVDFTEFFKKKGERKYPQFPLVVTYLNESQNDDPNICTIEYGNSSDTSNHPNSVSVK